MMRETMAGMEAALPGDSFMRVSRSAIVNLCRVQELNASPGRERAILKDGQEIQPHPQRARDRRPPGGLGNRRHARMSAPETFPALEAQRWLCSGG